MYWLIFFIGQGLFMVGSYLDYQSSLKFITHGLSEANKFNRDEHGYFSPHYFWRNRAIFWGIFTGLTVLFFYLSSEQVGGVAIPAIFGGTFIIAGGLSIFVAFRNNAGTERSRNNVQIPILKWLQGIKTYDYDAVENVFSHYGIWKYRSNKTKRIHPLMFPRFYKDGGNDEEFEEAFYRAIWELSQKPESEWFRDSSMVKL